MRVFGAFYLMLVLFVSANWRGIASRIAALRSGDDDDDDYELVGTFPEAETLTLATFHLSNGNEVRFLGVPALNELMMGEFTDAGESEDFVINSELHPAEIFRRLAPADSPVPRMLSRMDDANVLDGRAVVETLDSPIAVSLEALGIQAIPSAAPGGSCQPGTAGAQFFATHHCNTGGGPGYGSGESHCYSGAYNWIQKTSNSRRRATYTRMASCGSGMNRMRHFYRTTSGYTTQVNIYVDPQKVISWWSYREGVRRFRRVRFEEHQEGGFVRGWVRYHSEVAGGW
jgi:hypothetical protein